MVGLAVSLLSWIACASGGGAGSGAGSGAPASVDVRLGSEAVIAASHDVTMESLNAGQTEYSIEGMDGRTFHVSLDASQVQDLLDGSTIMADGTGTDGQTETIRIGVNKPSKKGFGW
jgi:hypothetical protein